MSSNPFILFYNQANILVESRVLFSTRTKPVAKAVRVTRRQSIPKWSFPQSLLHWALSQKPLLWLKFQQLLLLPPPLWPWVQAQAQFQQLIPLKEPNSFVVSTLIYLRYKIPKGKFWQAKLFSYQYSPKEKFSKYILLFQWLLKAWHLGDWNSKTFMVIFWLKAMSAGRAVLWHSHPK